MLTRVTAFFGKLLVAGGPSVSRLVMLITTVVGGLLLYYGARAGSVDWPWTVAFLGYLAYGLGPHTLGKYFYTLRYIKGGKDDPEDKQ